MATGGKARVPPIPGTNNKIVHTLRDGKDMEAIKGKVQTAKDVVIIGGSFIGSEAASSLKMKFKD